MNTIEKSAKIDYAGTVMANNLSENNFFIRKADITLVNNKTTAGFVASIRFKKPDSLMIGIKSKLGIEAARAFLTRDTILINDKVNKKLLVGNVRILETKYGIDPSLIFVLLGDFIINKKDETRKVDCQNGSYQDNFVIKERKVDYIIDCKKKKVISAYFEGSLTTGNITIKYSRFTNMDGLPVPQLIELSDDMSTLKINMEIGKAEIGWAGGIDFFPGSGYEVVNLK